MSKTCWTCPHRLSIKTTEDNIRNYCKLTIDVRSNTGHKRIKAKGNCIADMAKNKVSDEVTMVTGETVFNHSSDLNITTIDGSKLVGFIKIQSRDAELNKKIVAAIKRVLNNS